MTKICLLPPFFLRILNPNGLLLGSYQLFLCFQTWYFATVQIFFSTHIGLGNIVTGAGRFYSKSNAVW